MAISQKEVEYVANLARIKLGEKELEQYALQLDKILEYINKLKELDVKEVKPMSHVLDINNIMRKDQLRPSLKQAEVLNCAPSQDKGHFRVPKVVE